ncbi:nickel pincer cofactor biosynthesis protein LarC [Aminobacterium mobile]|jgi:uncharacterized protein (TIGR00299 family) protein|uniref:nickel pincer cofactor biosynthesis protein LarC n=1 Tax=Aminobacterium mobile TaxID=81467 RepID=UPI000466B602|nr:nickel pincer cofactor biosynthesis protein LarC [Aminobacterium mobile]
MKILYLDCFSGISGDMFLGALLDLGLDRDEFLRKMSTLHIPHGHYHDHGHENVHHQGEGYNILVSDVVRKGFSGISVKIESSEDHPHRGLMDIWEIIDKSSLSQEVKDKSKKAFLLLATAEGKVHGLPPEKVHFHEVGAVDSIMDIVGACVLIEMLSPDKIVCSPLNVGSGTVECAHGILPVPAPATEQLLAGIPIYSAGGPMERVTPTGALLVKMFAHEFGNIPEGIILRSGRGLGERESDLPNFLRAILLERENEGKSSTATKEEPFLRDEGIVLETNIDDMNPQYYEPVMERLFSAGAMDVWLDPIIMKKGRPAIRLCCLVSENMEEKAAEIILKGTTTLGLRRYKVDRIKLHHHITPIETTFGLVRIKEAWWGKERLRVNPEYDDLKRISRETGIPLNKLREEILRQIDKNI